MLNMTEPQIWTMMSAFIALMFGQLTIVPTLFVRVARSEIGTVREEIGTVREEIGTVRAETRGGFGVVRGEIGVLRAETRAGFARIDGLDRDVQALVKHTFGIDRG
ncbi:hypothetical protein [Microbacterium sp. XT11]|uniref:hypothetical protein n=1 Tax=Microbacterium sp. XT11 TaxID=367477 RepID=UPI000742E895|nr:hypothetical protein [Microbacterium sp. XT11]ALX65638.1 hypothetical protein AB663_000230 [Microbacterium sp. XT11]